LVYNSNNSKIEQEKHNDGQNMNHVDSNFATINISPIARFLGGAILRYQHSFPGFSGVHVAQSLVYEQKLQVCQLLLPWQPNSFIWHLQKNAKNLDFNYLLSPVNRVVCE
jgi:hypothetical protein